MKEIIKKMYTHAISNNLSADDFADKILLLFGINLPDDYISPMKRLPENGCTVNILTNTGKHTYATFEMFLGNEIWETDYVDNDEIIIGWKYYDN